VTVAVTPASVTLKSSQTQQFTATVSNASNTAVTWTLSPNVGSLSAAGLYTAPPTISTPQTVTLTATSVADATKTATATVSLSNLGPWSNQDIGAVQQAGSTNYDSGTGTFTVSGSGSYIWYAADGFQYVYQPLTGDGSIVARIVGIQNANTYSKPGVMIRETLTASSKHALMTIFGGQKKPSFAYRTATGGTTADAQANAVNFPYWVKLVRQGSVFTGYVSANGTAWTAVASPVTISMAETVYVGLVVSANLDGGTFPLTTATFDNVNIAMVPVSVSVSPATASLTAGQTQQFTATVANTGNTAVTWALSPNVGSISASGLYTAPTTISTQQTVTVTATSTADITRSATATINLNQ
jgi:hypothetical protein